MAESPLIVNNKAARRLRLLQLPPSLHSAAAATARASATAATLVQVLAKHGGSLPAALLPESVKISSNGSIGLWQHDRDVLAEVAVTARTLEALKLSSGAMVLVANAGRTEVPAHLARLLALPEAPGHCGGPTAASASADGIAYLAPCLAYNLGLGLHLWPLLRGSSTPDTGCVDSSSSTVDTSSGGPHDRVIIQRYTCSADQQEQKLQEQQQWHHLAQPGSDTASVPVAAEVHIAVVRTPVAVMLQQRIKPQNQPGCSSEEAQLTAEDSGGGADGSADSSSGNGAASGAGGASSNSAVPGPAEKASDAAVGALQQWLLASCRVVHQGDVLAVPRLPPGSSGGTSSSQLLPLALPNLCAAVQPAGGPAVAAPPLELLYFRVPKLVLPRWQQTAARAGPLCTTAAAVLVGSTTVRLVGSCNSGLPVGLPDYLATTASPSSIGGASDYVLGAHAFATAAPHPQLPPVGLLLPAWRQLAELLASVLHPAAAGVPLRLAVLLQGPSGSGKHTAAAAAAAAVGCHLISLSCHNIKAAAGAAERHTFEGLRAAFAAAADYAPTVLLLRQLSVLGDGSSHGGSASSSSQSYAARLGSVLADCIRRHSGSSSSASGFSKSAPSDGNWLFPAPVVLVASAASADELPPALRRCFTHELALEAPDQAQRQKLLHSSLAGMTAAPDLLPTAMPAAAAGLGSEGLENAARHTAGLLPRELRAVAADAAAAVTLQVLPAAAVLEAAGAASPPVLGRNGLITHVQPTVASKGLPQALSQHHLSAAIEVARQRTATDIGGPRIPSVHWEDVGGLQDIKRAILDTVELPLKHPELFGGGLRRRSGVLLYGPPGTGKTLLAKAVATECSISFLSVKGPELINMYVGESERQIREVFARARRARPCVVFFDELDSLAPARGRGSDSGGIMDRVVSQLLAEIDGVQGAGGNGDVFLVGATNRPDLLDPALLRPGRLDKLLYVGIASDVASRLQVLQALTRKFKLADGVELAEVAERCADRFTGADLYALCSDAWMAALKRSIMRMEQQRQQPADGSAGSGGDGSKAEGDEVVVTQGDLLEAAHSLQPSLSTEEVAKYKHIREQYNSSQQR